MHPLDDHLEVRRASLERDCLPYAFLEIAIENLVEESGVVTKQILRKLETLVTHNYSEQRAREVLDLAAYILAKKSISCLA
jgi:hypothetical protein